jgi:hypothetical protein
MSGLFEIIQYEVQVFRDGYWEVRGRYPRAGRDHAFMQARLADLNEMLPTRVVRDVYDPASGRSQEFTIFMSDRAKTAKLTVHAPPPKPSAPAPKIRARQHEGRPAPLAFRVTMAVGVGVVTALLITAIATWALTPEQESFASVIARSPAPGPSMTLFIAVTLFSVFTMLRGPLGISRLARSLGARLSRHEARPISTPAPARREPAMRTAVQAAHAPDHAPDHDTQVLLLARVMLARFFTEAAPANVPDALEDDLGRRGFALYLAGAASELAAHLEMPSPGDLMTQISPAILQNAAKEMLHEVRALGAADAALMAAGRSAMRNYVSAAEESPSMAGPLAAWHKAARAEALIPEVLREAKAS